MSRRITPECQAAAEFIENLATIYREDKTPALVWLKERFIKHYGTIFWSLITPKDEAQKKIVEALKFYADEKTYKLNQRSAGPQGACGIEWREIEHDRGKRAREALSTLDGGNLKEDLT